MQLPILRFDSATAATCESKKNTHQAVDVATAKRCDDLVDRYEKDIRQRGKTSNRVNARPTGTYRLYVIIMTVAQHSTQDTPNNPGSKQKARPTKFSHDRWRRRWCFHRHNKISSGRWSGNACNAQQTCQTNC